MRKSILLPLIFVTDLQKVLMQSTPKKPTASILPFPKGRDLIPSIESQVPEVYSQTLKPNEICLAKFLGNGDLFSFYFLPFWTRMSTYNWYPIHCIMGVDNLFLEFYRLKQGGKLWPWMDNIHNFTQPYLIQ